MKKLLDVFLKSRNLKSTESISETFKESNVLIDTEVHPIYGRRVILKNDAATLKISINHLLKEID